MFSRMLTMALRGVGKDLLTRLGKSRPTLTPRGDAMLRKRFLYCLSSISWIFIAISVLYFKIFPNLINPVFSDIFITSLIFLSVLSLIAGSFVIQTSRELILFMPQCLLICFLARCIRYLRLPYPALWDPYAFLVAFLNIHDFGTLEPIYSYWYPVEGLINWPSMIIITEFLSRIGQIDYMWLFNYQQPILGMVFFLGVYLLAYTVSKNYGISLLSGLISSLSSHVIFYQSEYHYQGLAFIIFIFLLIGLLKTCKSKSNSAYKILVVIFTVACTFSHYFSSLFIVVVLGSFFCITYILSKFSEIYRNTRLNVLNVNRPDDIFFLLLFLLVLGYHLFVFPEHIEIYIQRMASANPYHAPVVSITGNVPFPTNIIHSIRYATITLGLASIFFVIKTKKNEEIILATICLFLISLGLLGNALIYLEVGRIVAFYEVIIGIFAALTLFRLRDIWLRPLNKQKAITSLICIVTAGIITLTFFGGHYVPAYYFKSLDQNSYYWYDNNLPDMQKYEAGGLWIYRYVPENPLILTDNTPYFVRSAIFFWGKTPVDRFKLLDSYQYHKSTLNENIFITSNVKSNPGLNEEILREQTSRVYFNGEIEINSV